MKILISAGEASGDLYASALVAAIRRRVPEAEFFGCTGPRLRAAGVRTVVDAASLAVVGLVEVVRHIPRILGEFKKLEAAVRAEKPDLAILTDAPDFHLRLARRLRPLGIPVVYLVAPQVWAWRQGRIPQMRRDIARLLCIFPFEEAFFRGHGVAATYIGHPLTRLIAPAQSREDFYRKHGIPGDRPMLVLLPGSRPGEIARHLPVLRRAVDLIASARSCTFVLATPANPAALAPIAGQLTNFKEPKQALFIQHIEGETWDAIAHADAALAASGTVTVEAALLGTPVAAFYKVSPLSWWMGRYLVRVPFYTMVNILAERPVIPELIQDSLTPESLAREGLRLIDDGEERARMRRDLGEVRRLLTTEDDPMEKAAEVVVEMLRKDGTV